jgi:hypothetical protein
LLEIEDIGTVYLDPVVHISLHALIVPLENLDHPMPPFLGHASCNNIASSPVPRQSMPKRVTPVIQSLMILIRFEKI